MRELWGNYIKYRKLKRFGCDGGEERGDKSQKGTRKRLFCFLFDCLRWEIVEYV